MENSCASVGENRAEDNFDLVERRIRLAEGRKPSEPGAKLAYRIEAREDRLQADAVVRVAIDVRGLRDRIDREVAKLRRG